MINKILYIKNWKYTLRFYGHAQIKSKMCDITVGSAR